MCACTDPDGTVFCAVYVEHGVQTPMLIQTDTPKTSNFHLVRKPLRMKRPFVSLEIIKKTSRAPRSRASLLVTAVTASADVSANLTSTILQQQHQQHLQHREMISPKIVDRTVVNTD